MERIGVSQTSNQMSTFKHYCGAGLAYRFAEMLITNKDLLDKLLVLAGIAIVADVVPLIGANRYLVRQSLKLINRGIATSGVLALVRKMRLEKITAEDYGYKIGPVCNASGRLLDDGAMDIFHLLSQELDVFALDYDEQLLKLHALADTVIERNVDRRRITEEALERSDALISQQCLADDAVYIIYDTQVSEGVMGIVAGKLAEKYMRPVIVFAHAQDGEKLKGSGRTYGNIHLKNQVLDPCKEYFFAYGGHAGAAGMTIPESAECQLNYNYRQCTKTSSGWIAIHLWNSRCSVYDQQSKRKGKTRIPWLCRINAGNFSGIRDAMCKCRRNRMVEGKDVQYGLPHRSPRYSQSK